MYPTHPPLISTVLLERPSIKSLLEQSNGFKDLWLDRGREKVREYLDRMER